MPWRLTSAHSTDRPVSSNRAGILANTSAVMTWAGAYMAFSSFAELASGGQIATPAIFS